MSKVSRMFSFAKPVNPLGGRCLFGCRYCFATGSKGIVKRYGLVKYLGDPYFKYVKLPPFSKDEQKCYFLCDMLDLFSPNIKQDLILKVIGFIKNHPRATFLILTKNPIRYFENFDEWAALSNVMYGATIETDLKVFHTESQFKHYNEISYAPMPRERLYQIYALRQRFKLREKHPKIFLSIEPVLKFSLDFHSKIISLLPDLVAIGYDNYNWHLPEPYKADVEGLILRLQGKNIDVIKKTIRKAWYEE